MSGFDDRAIGELLRSLDVRERRDRPETFDLDLALEAAAREPATKPGDRISSARTSSAAATRRRPATSRRSSATAGPISQSWILPTTSRIGVADGPGDGAARSPTTTSIRRPSRHSSGLGPEVLLAVVEGALYIFMSSKELPLVSRVLAAGGGHWSDTIIRAKDAFTLGRADYQRTYEPIWYGWREGPATTGAGIATGRVSGRSPGRHRRRSIRR